MPLGRAAMMPRFRCLRWSLALLAVFAAAGLAQAATVEEIALMNRADRQKILVEGARKEGKVSWYTTLIVDQVVRPVKDAFEKEYPFIQVEFFRGNTERIVQRMIAEYQAKRYEADLIDGTVSPTMVRRAGLLQRFYSPMFAEYPAELRDAQGFWGATNLYFFATGYNTRMVKANEVPKSYEDLLNPRWKGQMMWSTSRGSGAPMFVGTILSTMGTKRAKRTCKNSSAKCRQDHGEQPASARFDHCRRISAGAADLQSSRVYQQIGGRAGGVASSMSRRRRRSITLASAKFASHPHAAMLLIDFILSEKGQKVYQQSNYLPAHPKVPAKQVDLKPGGGRFKRAFYINPDAAVRQGQ